MVELTIAAIRDHYRSKRAAKQESLPYPVPAEEPRMPSPNAAPMPAPKPSQPAPEAYNMPQAHSQMPPSNMTNDFDAPRKSRPVERGVEMPTIGEPVQPPQPPPQVRNPSPPKMRPVKSLIPPSPTSKDLPDLPKPRPQKDTLNLPLDSPKYTNFFSSEEMFHQAVVPRPLVHDLVNVITAEIKARGILTPYLMLPFRPDSDPGAVPALVNHIFPRNFQPLSGEELLRTVRNAEIYTLCGVLKWCWCRMPGGVVSWPVYNRFVQAEKEGHTDHDAFLTLIPRCIETEAHASILYDFMDLLAAIATHGKKNGMGGRKLARLAGTWAFDVNTGADGPVSFQDGLNTWSEAAEATNHLFFSFLRTMLPTKDSRNDMNRIPRSLESLLVSSVYPPLPLHKSRLVPVPLVTLTVGKLSSSPLVLLKRAAKTVRFDNPSVFATEDDFNTLFFLFKDPKIVEQKLSPESKRVLHDIVQENPLNNEVYYDTRAAEWKVRSSKLPANQNGDYRAKTWSKHYNSTFTDPATGARSSNPHNYVYDADEGYGYNVRSNQNVSTWEEFKRSGFEPGDPTQRPSTALSGRSIPMNIPWASTLPGQNGDTAPAVKSGYEQKVTAAVSQVAIDDFFVWVWMSSLSIEQPEMNKALFGRSVVVEVEISPGPGGRRWVVVEEILYPPPITPAPKAPEPKPRPIPKRVVSTPAPIIAPPPPKKKHTRRKSEKVITFEYDDLDPLVAAVADRIERRNSQRRVSLPTPPPPPPKMADSSTQTYCDQQTQTDPVDLPDEFIIETTPEPQGAPYETSRDLGVQTMSTQSTRNSMATMTMGGTASGLAAAAGVAAAVAATAQYEERPDSKSSDHTNDYSTPMIGLNDSFSRSVTPEAWVPDSPPTLSELHISPKASEEKHQPLQPFVSMIIDSSPERTPVATPAAPRTPKLVKRKPVGSAPVLPAVADDTPVLGPPLIERPESVGSGFSNESVHDPYAYVAPVEHPAPPVEHHVPPVEHHHAPQENTHTFPADIYTPESSEWGEQGTHVARGPYNTAPYQMADRGPTHVTAAVPAHVPAPAAAPAPAPAQAPVQAREVANEPPVRTFPGPITVAATAAAATAAARAAAGGPPGAPETPISMAHSNIPSAAPSVATASDSEAAYRTASTTDASPVYERDSRVIPSDISHAGLQISGIKNQKLKQRAVSPGVYSSDQSSYEYGYDYTDDSEYEHLPERGMGGARGRGGRGRGRGRGGAMGPPMGPGHMGMQRSFSPQGYPGQFGYPYGYWPGMMGPGMGMMGPQGMGPQMGMMPQGMGQGMGMMPQGMGMMGPQGMGMGPQGMGMGQGMGMAPMAPSPAASKSSQSLPSVDSAFLDKGPMGMSSSGALKNVSKRHTPKRDLQSPVSMSSGSSFGPLAGRQAPSQGPMGPGMGPMGPQGMGMGMGMNGMGMNMNMGNMAMMRQGMSPQHMAMGPQGMMGPMSMGNMSQGNMSQGSVMSDSDSDANYYPGGPPRYLRKLGRGAEATDRKGSHSENRPPYGYPMALDKGKEKESPDPRSFDPHPVSQQEQDEVAATDSDSVVDSYVGSNVATVIADEQPRQLDNSPHQSEMTLKLDQTPLPRQAHPYASSQSYQVPTQHHSSAPESPPDTPTSGPTIHDIRQSWNSEYEQRQAIPPLPAVVTEEDVKSDSNVQTSLSTAMGVDDYVSASVHLNRNPSIVTGAHVSSVAVPLDDAPTHANNVDQPKPLSRGKIEPNPYRVSAPAAPRDAPASFKHTRSVSTSQLNKALPPPPIDVNVANFSESTSSLGSAKTPTSGESPNKRSSLFFRRNGPPSDEQVRELQEQETLSKEHIVSWVDRRRPDGKRVFSAGPYDAV